MIRWFPNGSTYREPAGKT